MVYEELLEYGKVALQGKRIRKLRAVPICWVTAEIDGSHFRCIVTVWLRERGVECYTFAEHGTQFTDHLCRSLAAHSSVDRILQVTKPLQLNLPFTISWTSSIHPAAPQTNQLPATPHLILKSAVGSRLQALTDCGFLIHPNLAHPVEKRLLLLRPNYVLDHKHEELLTELEIVNSLEHLLIIEPATLDILPDLRESTIASQLLALSRWYRNQPYRNPFSLFNTPQRLRIEIGCQP